MAAVSHAASLINEQASQDAGGQVDRPVVQVKDALRYLDSVKAQFPEDQSDMYNQFVGIMTDFKVRK